MKFNRGWLVHDWDNRDPSSKLEDIDCGGYLEALSSLSDNHRQLLQDNSMHINLTDMEDSYRVSKVVKMREAEYLQGSAQYFVLDSEGKRIPIDEDEWEKLTGGNPNPEDVYNHPDAELQGIEEWTTPRDTWDILFDATPFIQASRQLLEDEVWQTKPGKQKLQDLEDLSNGVTIVVQHDNYSRKFQGGIYSADWFPYPADKRLRSCRALGIAERIKHGLTRGQLAHLLRDQIDTTASDAVAIRKAALQLPLGKERAMRLQRAEEIRLSAPSLSDRNKSGTITPSEKRRLWDIWRDKELADKGTVELTHWQYAKALKAKLLKQGMSSLQANERVKECVCRLFKQEVRALDLPTKEVDVEDLLSWMREAPLPEENYND